MLLSLSSYFLRRKKLRSYIISRVFSAATGDYFTFYNSYTFFFLSIFKHVNNFTYSCCSPVGRLALLT